LYWSLPIIAFLVAAVAFCAVLISFGMWLPQLKWLRVPILLVSAAIAGVSAYQSVVSFGPSGYVSAIDCGFAEAMSDSQVQAMAQLMSRASPEQIRDMSCRSMRQGIVADGAHIQESVAARALAAMATSGNERRRQAARALLAGETPARSLEALLQLGRSANDFVQVGTIALALGQQESAELAFGRARSLAPDRADAVIGAANAALLKDDSSVADRLYQEAQSLERARRRDESEVIYRRGLAAANRSDDAAARTLFEEARGVAIVRNNALVEAMSLRELGRIESRARRWQDAADYLTESANAFESARDIANLALTLCDAAEANLLANNAQLARDQLTRGVPLIQQHFPPIRSVCPLSNLGRAEYALGDFRAAEQHYRHALRAAEEAGSTPQQVAWLMHLVAESLERQQRYTDAVLQFELELNALRADTSAYAAERRAHTYVHLADNFQRLSAMSYGSEQVIYSQRAVEAYRAAGRPGAAWGVETQPQQTEEFANYDLLFP
jgi:tetratricopeptide (TPR) repeat protein